MDILVIGATGMVGSRIVSEAVSRGHRVTAASRKGAADKRNGVDAVALNIYDRDAVAEQAAKADVVVSAVSPRNTGDATAEAIAFTQALIDGVADTRLIQVGGASSLFGEDGETTLKHAPEAVKPEAAGMLAAFELLEKSDRDWTVQAPAQVISPGERTGRFRIGGRIKLPVDEGPTRISAEDFAVALVDEIESPQHRGEIYHAAY